MRAPVGRGWSLRGVVVPLVLVWGGAGSDDARADEVRSVKPKSEGEIAWYDVRDWGVEGKGWSDTRRYFDRLPGRAEKVVREPVWVLSRHSAGMLTRFETDATELHVRYTLLDERLAMPHMPATGVSGVDLYAENERGQWRWLAVVLPSEKTISRRIVQGLSLGRRRFMLYLPLYNGVDALEIGVPRGAKFSGLAPRTAKPILFYGTSIIQGACASRPGMPHPAILGRWLDCPVLNLGFSGNGRMGSEVVELLAELDPSVFVIDCLPNMLAADVAERVEPLVSRIRKARPKTPIVLVEDRTLTNAVFLPNQQSRHEASRVELRGAYKRLVASGIKGLHYVEGERLLGSDGEGATDGSHPSDLGFLRMAHHLKPLLTQLTRSKREGVGGE